MTTNKRAKSAARARQTATGERYTDARRNESSLQHPVFHDDFCANCLDELYEGVEGIYCSQLCSQTAETVRYMRRVRKDARFHNPDVKIAIQTRLAHILAGGYDKAARHLDIAQRRVIWNREKDLCASCGNFGAEIDHIDGSSDDPRNLQLLCLDCHHAKTAARMVPASPEQAAWIRDLIQRRVDPDIPVLLADDDVNWNSLWRRLKSSRRARLVDELKDLGYATRDFPGMSWQEMWDDVLGGDEYNEGDADGEDVGYFARTINRDD